MNLFSLKCDRFRLSNIYERGMIYVPVCETGHSFDGRKELEEACVCFPTKAQALEWVKANQHDYTKLRIVAFKAV
mgnify:CR=1 FL=1